MIDSSSSNNFIQIEVAELLKFNISPTTLFQVTIDSGTKPSCDRICKKIELIINGTCLFIDLFSLPMASYNVVLETSRMKEVVPITTDFSNFSMKFNWKDEEVYWIGQPWVDDELFSGS